VWIGLYEPSEALLERVQKEFCLHDLAVEDAHKAHQRPKIALYGDSLFIVMRTAQINRERSIESGETPWWPASMA
jgi:Mg2+ and Co2+ transporters